ncbi:hypothetical protein Tco_1080186 [Tanacetum coccineum]|uniref:Uncharacterized protein n=1 Tax=Tanacetum coccineum TaxID=301880 RepID=A0ABQ5HTZ8_9ASTR
MFDKAFKRVNTFKDFRTELVEGSTKRARDELMQESAKKQKVDADTEKEDLKVCLEIVPDEEVAIDVVPLAVKPAPIVDWKIHKEGKKRFYQIMRADGSSELYLVFSRMLKEFNREYLETLYKLVKIRYKSSRPVGDDRVLWGDLKTMFEPNMDDEIWRNQQGYTLLSWKLFESCGVHSLMMDYVYIHMLVEKKYPLVPITLSRM